MKKTKISTILSLLRENIGMMLLRKRSYSSFVHYPVIAGKERSKYRSVILRHLDCGSCQGCELALLRLENPVIDILQYNIKAEASPRHAYFLAMTGPITRNSLEAAEATVTAMPVEAIIAVGDCAVDGGMFKSSYAIAPRPNAISERVVLEIPGCPPSPLVLEQKLLEIKAK